MFNCFKIVAKEEGVHGFFKGLAPSTCKVHAFFVVSLFL